MISNLIKFNMGGKAYLEGCRFEVRFIKLVLCEAEVSLGGDSAEERCLSDKSMVRSEPGHNFCQHFN
jgi:hypothetical protein